MLEVTGLQKHFDGIVAVDDLSFHVGDTELVGLIGPNGAGKTTVFNLLSGVLKPDRGTVTFNLQNITNKSIQRVASLGLTRTFQENMLFDNQTCFDNIRIASHLFEETSILPFTLGIGAKRVKEQEYEERIHNILCMMGLSVYEKTLAGSLPHGIKRILGVSMAWATNPKLLLLDEPAAGMTMTEIQNLKELIYRLHNYGVGILLVEHNIKMITEICHRILVLNFGKLIAEGTPDQVLRDKDVIKAYLGI
jgi:branched-chain amino acid transport system ATP-binding protein